MNPQPLDELLAAGLLIPGRSLFTEYNGQTETGTLLPTGLILYKEAEHTLPQFRKAAKKVIQPGIDIRRQKSSRGTVFDDQGRSILELVEQMNNM